LAAVDVITVDPNSVDFGSLSVTADPTTRQITVTNTGIAAITLGGVVIAGTGSDAFSLQTNLGPDGVTLGLAECSWLSLRYPAAARHASPLTLETTPEGPGRFLE
jgi:hypothetical protein